MSRVAPFPAVTADPRPDPVRAFLLLGRLGPEASSVARALTRSGRVIVVGTTSDPFQGIEDASGLRPDVVLVDRFVGLADGLVVARHLHRDLPHAAIVLRTPWPDADRHEALRAGAHTSVDAAATADELLIAIDDATAAAGNRG